MFVKADNAFSGFEGNLKKVKRLTAIILISVISTCIISGCAEKKAPDNIAELLIEEKDEVVSFYGMNFNFFVNCNYYIVGDYVLGYVPGTIFAEAVLERIDDIEKKHDVKIKIDYSNEVPTALLASSAAAGYSMYSAVQDNSGDIVPAARAGHLFDLSQITDVLDYHDTARWGTPEQIKPLFWDNGLYGVIPAAYPMLKYNSICGLMAVNEGLVKEYGVTDPRELQETKNWTWSTFEEQMPLYYHKGESGNDVYAMYATVHWFFSAFQLTNGVPPVYKDDSGTWQLGISTPESLEAYATALNWGFGDFASYNKIDTSNSWQMVLEKFAVDQSSVLTVMTAAQLYGSTSSVAYTLKDFGVVNLPVGPKAVDGYAGANFNEIAYVTSIPINVEEPESVGFILNALYDYLPGYEDDDSVITYLTQNYFYDKRDAEVFLKSYENAFYQYRNEGITDLAISINGKRTAAEWIEKTSTAAEANRVKYVINIEDSIEALFGTSD